MMYSLKMFVKALIGRSSALTDSGVELLYKYTSKALFLCCIIIASVQILGQPMNCTMTSQDADGTRVVDSLCWSSKNFRFPPNSSFHRDTYYRAYYQWIPIVFSIQGCFFLLTFSICRRERQLVAANGRLKELHSKCNPRRCDVVPASRFFILTCHVFILVNSLVNLFFVDWFLGNALTRYGFGILKLPFLDQPTRDDVILTVLPRVVRCSLKTNGHVCSDAICTASINVLNEKILVGLCLWFVTIAFIVCLQICLDLVHLGFLLANRRPCRVLRTKLVDATNKQIQVYLSPAGHLCMHLPGKPSNDMNQGKGEKEEDVSNLPTEAENVP